MTGATGVGRTEGARSAGAIGSCLVRYRVMATLVGIALLLILAVGVPLQIAGHDGFEKVVATAHGWVLFPLYLLASADLAWRMRWSAIATLSVLAAGVVPVGSFYVESRVRRNVRAHTASGQSSIA